MSNCVHTRTKQSAWNGRVGNGGGSRMQHPAKDTDTQTNKQAPKHMGHFKTEKKTATNRKQTGLTRL